MEKLGLGRQVVAEQSFPQSGGLTPLGPLSYHQNCRTVRLLNVNLQETQK